jgi:hypothetical protein
MKYLRNSCIFVQSAYGRINDGSIAARDMLSKSLTRTP